MYVSTDKIRMYSCALERKFIAEYDKEVGRKAFVDGGSFLEQGYDTNDLLEFMISYPEANDRTKQRYYFLCERLAGDVPEKLAKEYRKLFGLIRCGLDVNDSYGCRFCSAISRCNCLDECFGCCDCRFSNHLLYCDGIRHSSYMAFNKQVTKKRFAELIKLTPEQIKSVPEFDPELFGKAMGEISKAYAPRSANA